MVIFLKLYVLGIVNLRIINYILVSISSELLNKTDIEWLILSEAEVFSRVLLGVDDVSVAHTLVPWAFSRLVDLRIFGWCSIQ